MDRLSAIVVGGGRMGRRYAQLLASHPSAQLLAIVGNTAEGLEIADKDFPNIPTIVDGLQADLFSRLPKIDAVVIATPEWAHEEAAVLAARQGKHLLIEKPICDNFPGAKRIADAAIASGKVAMPCHTVRFDARAIAARNQLFVEKRIGKVRRIYARRNADTNAYARLSGRTDPVFWLLPHDLDLLTFLTGEQIVKLRGRLISGPRDDIGGIVCEAVLESGTDVTLETSWVTPPHSQRSRTTYMDFFGDAGSIELDQFHGGVTVFSEASSAECIDPYYAPQTDAFVSGADAGLIDHFVRVALGLCEPICDITDGLKVIELAAAIRRSIDDNCTVEVGD